MYVGENIEHALSNELEYSLMQEDVDRWSCSGLMPIPIHHSA